MLNSESPWRNISIDSLEVISGAFGMPLSSSCHWCPHEAYYLVQRTSTDTANTYESRACAVCAAGWHRVEKSSS